MPQLPAPYDLAEIQSVWEDRNFHKLGLEARRQVMNRMDPDFAKLPYEEQNKVFEDMYREYGTEKPRPVVEQELNQLVAQKFWPGTEKTAEPKTSQPTFGQGDIQKGGEGPFSLQQGQRPKAPPADMFRSAPPPTTGVADQAFDRFASPQAVPSTFRAPRPPEPWGLPLTPARPLSPPEQELVNEQRARREAAERERMRAFYGGESRQMEEAAASGRMAPPPAPLDPFLTNPNWNVDIPARERGVSPSPETMAATAGDPSRGLEGAMGSVWNPGATMDELWKKPETHQDAVSQGIIRLIADTASVKNLAIMFGAGAAGSGLKWAANNPAVRQILGKLGITGEAADVIARSAIPTVFGGMAAAGAGTEVGKALQTEGPERTQHIIGALGDGLMTWLGAYGATEAIKGTRALYPGSEIPTTRTSKTVNGVTAAYERPMAPQEALQRSEMLEQRGDRNAAQAWWEVYKNLRNRGSEPLTGAFGQPIDVVYNGKPHRIEFIGRDTQGRVNFGLIDPANPGKPVYAGRPADFNAWLESRGVDTPTGERYAGRLRAEYNTAAADKIEAQRALREDPSDQPAQALLADAESRLRTIGEQQRKLPLEESGRAPRPANLPKYDPAEMRALGNASEHLHEQLGGALERLGDALAEENPAAADLLMPQRDPVSGLLWHKKWDELAPELEKLDVNPNVLPYALAVQNSYKAISEIEGKIREMRQARRFEERTGHPAAQALGQRELVRAWEKQQEGEAPTPTPGSQEEPAPTLEPVTAPTPVSHPAGQPLGEVRPEPAPTPQPSTQEPPVAEAPKEPWQYRRREHRTLWEGKTPPAIHPVLAVNMDQEDAESLKRWEKKDLRALSYVLGGRMSGTKDELIGSAIQIWKMRTLLKPETLDTLQEKTGADLDALIRGIGDSPFGNKYSKASRLIGWRDEKRTGSKQRVVDAIHQFAVEKAHQEGKQVPREVLEEYPHLIEPQPKEEHDPEKWVKFKDVADELGYLPELSDAHRGLTVAERKGFEQRWTEEFEEAKTRKVEPAPLKHPATYYTTSSYGEGVQEAARQRGDIGITVTPKHANLEGARHFPSVIVDNGVFSKDGFHEAKWRKLVREVAASPDLKAKTRFVVAPDHLIHLDDGSVVGDAKGTNVMFPRYAQWIHHIGLPVAYVAQNGLEDMLDQIPWDQMDAIFVGGDDAWKEGRFPDTPEGREASKNWHRIWATARHKGIPIHVGRVNSARRLNLSVFGATAVTVDGNHPAHHPDNINEVGKWLDLWNTKPEERPRTDADEKADDIITDLTVELRTFLEKPASRPTPSPDALRKLVERAEQALAGEGLSERFAQELRQLIASARALLTAHRPPKPETETVTTPTGPKEIEKRELTTEQEKILADFKEELFTVWRSIRLAEIALEETEESDRSNFELREKLERRIFSKKDDYQFLVESAEQHLPERIVRHAEDEVKFRTIYIPDDYPEGKPKQFETWTEFREQTKIGDTVYFDQGRGRLFSGVITDYIDHERIVQVKVHSESIPENAPIKPVTDTGRFNVQAELSWEDIYTKPPQTIDVTPGGPKTVQTPTGPKQISGPKTIDITPAPEPKPVTTPTGPKPASKPAAARPRPQTPEEIEAEAKRIREEKAAAAKKKLAEMLAAKKGHPAKPTEPALMGDVYPLEPGEVDADMIETLGDLAAELYDEVGADYFTQRKVLRDSFPNLTDDQRDEIYRAGARAFDASKKLAQQAAEAPEETPAPEQEPTGEAEELPPQEVEKTRTAEQEALYDRWNSIGESKKVDDHVAEIILTIANRLASGESMGDNVTYNRWFAEELGESTAEGRVSTEDLYDYLETAVALFIQEEGPSFLETDPADALKQLTEFMNLLPRQSTRGAEKDKFQQFSTPPPFGYIAVLAAGIKRGETGMEPSGGTAQLASWMRAAGADVLANEISQRRAGLLRWMDYPTAMIDAEHLNTRIYNDPRVKAIGQEEAPTVIVMNPPFSMAGERGVQSNDVGYRHLDQALQVLADGGRVVVIMGRGQAPFGNADGNKWWDKWTQKYNVRLALLMPGKEYARYGTTFDNSMMVIDKTGPTPGETFAERARNIKVVEAKTYADALSHASRIGSERSGRPLVEEPAPGSEEPESGGPRRTGGSGGEGVHERPADREPRPVSGEREPGGATPTGSHGPGSGGGESGGLGGGGERAPSGERPDLGDDRAPVPRDRPVESIGASDIKAGEDVGEDGKFARYKPAKLPEEWGAQPHRGDVIETAAMAGTEPPPIYLKPNIPEEIIHSGGISEVQLEAVSYALQSFTHTLPDGRVRGFFLGDGTGVGKGRTLASVIIHHWNSWKPEWGPRRFLWASDNARLQADAQRDMRDLGYHSPLKQMTPRQIASLAKETREALAKEGYDHIPIFLHGDVRWDRDLPWEEGIVFSPYTSLRQQPSMGPEEKKEKQRLVKEHGKDSQEVKDYDARLRAMKNNQYPRLEQVLKWLGTHPVIIFDEAHRAKNAVEQKGSRGKSKASRSAQAVIALDQSIPNARIVYASATGATDVANLGYLGRLGVWGPGTAFDKFNNFQQEIERDGIAAMETVARDLKAKGLYLARFLSFEPTEFDSLEHKLTDKDREIWNEASNAWSIVLKNMTKALEITNGDSKARSAAISQFWAFNQRFGRQVFSALKLPTMLQDMEEELRKGHSPVVSFLYTGEASQKRALQKAAEEETGLEDLDLTPFQILQQYLDRAFPIINYIEVVDPDDPTGARVIRIPEQDENGDYVINPEAKALRDATQDRINHVAKMLPGNPLDSIIEKFKPENVAELTGRKSRLIRDPETGEVTIDKRKIEGIKQDQLNIEEARLFQAGTKKIAIISPASSTGISLHADNRVKNQDRRTHYLFQLKWSADEQIQDAGRTNRTNQSSGPIYRLVTIPIGGDKRFASTIARRLAQLGALTRGQSGSVGAGDIAKYNFESDQGNQAAYNIGMGLFSGKYKEVIPNGLETLADMGLVDMEHGAQHPPALDVKDLLNRIIALDVDRQNKVFQLFEDEFRRLVSAAARLGLLNEGLTEIKADSIVHAEEPRVVWRDDETGAKTVYYHLNIRRRRERIDVDQAKGYVATGKYRFMTTRAGASAGSNAPIYLVEREGTQDTDGNYYHGVVDAGGRWRRIEQNELSQNHSFFMALSPEQEARWEKRWEEAGEFSSSNRHIFSGAILDNWNKFKPRADSRLTFAMARTEETKIPTGQEGVSVVQPGERIVGVDVLHRDIGLVLKAFNADKGPQFTPYEIYSQVMDHGTAFRLTGGMTLRRATIKGERRLELIDVPPGQYREVERLGAFNERIDYKLRFFIPATPNNLTALENILRQFPVLGAETPKSQERQEKGDQGGGPATSSLSVPAGRARYNTPAEGLAATDIQPEDAFAMIGQPVLPPLTEDSAEAKIAAVSRSEIEREVKTRINELFGSHVPVRKGKFRVKHALGIYKIVQQVIRLKGSLDIPVLSHEMGHHINNMMWGYTKSKGLNEGPLAQFKNELEAIATPARAGQSAVPEGFAEFIRHYLTQPAVVQQATPNFYRWFEDEMPDDLIKALKDIRSMVQRWTSQGWERRISQSIDMGDRRSRIQRAKDWLADARSGRTGTFDRFYTQAVDQLRPIEKAVQAMRSMGGETMPDQDAYTLARLLAGWWGKAEHFLYRGTFNANSMKEDGGKSLQAILKPAEKYLEADEIDNRGPLRRYLIASRALELILRKRQEIRNGKVVDVPDPVETGLTYKDALRAVNIYEEKYPEFKQIAKDLYAYQDKVLRYVVDSGMMSEDDYNNIKRLNLFYVPFYRITEFTDKDQADPRSVAENEMRRRTGHPAGKRRMVNVQNPVRKIRGSEAEIIDPIDSIIKNTFMVISAADRNRVGLSLVRQAQKTDGAGYLVERVPGPLQATKFSLGEIKGALARAGIQNLNNDALRTIATVFRPGRQARPEQNEITVLSQGKRQYYEVAPDLYRALNFADEEQSNVYMRALAIPARMLRATATAFSPNFLFRNPIKDSMEAAMQAQYGFIPGWDTAKGVFHAVKRDDLYWEWKRAGGEHAAMVSLDREGLRKQLKDMLANKAKYPLVHPIDALRILSELMESATRVQVYQRARERGATMRGAAFASREATLDFARMGASVKALNMIQAFYNAQVQGLDKFIRTVRTAHGAGGGGGVGPNPLKKRFWKRGGVPFLVASVTMPTLLLYLANRNSKTYKKQPRWMKDRFWYVPTGLPEGHQFEYFIWPKPHLYGIVFATLPERIFEWIDTRDPAAFDDLWAVLGGAVPVPGLITAAVPPIEWWANRNFYTGKKTEPAHLERLLPEHRSRPDTAYLSKGLSDLANAVGLESSPAKMQQLLLGYGSGVARTAMFLSNFLKPGGVPRPAMDAADIPIAQAFVPRVHNPQAQPFVKFYDRYSRLTKAEESYKQSQDEPTGVASGAQPLTAEEEAEYDILREYEKQIRPINKEIREIDASPDIGSKEKKERINALIEERNDLAQSALDDIREAQGQTVRR